MRIVNPTFGTSVATNEELSVRPLDWLNDPIALFSNSKPNARELMDGLKAKLAAVRPVDNIDFIYKPSASQPASAAVIDEVAHKYRAALLALGDWGSCSSWSFHDSIELEKRGVTAYVIASNTFVPLVLAQARARKLDPKLIVVQHPVGGLNAEELVERIDTAYEALTEIMKA